MVEKTGVGKTAGIPNDELAAAKEKIKEKKLEAYDLLRYLMRTDRMIRASGYKDLEDATRKIITRVAKECEKIITDLERKYPD